MGIHQIFCEFPLNLPQSCTSPSRYPVCFRPTCAKHPLAFLALFLLCSAAVCISRPEIPFRICAGNAIVRPPPCHEPFFLLIQLFSILIPHDLYNKPGIIANFQKSCGFLLIPYSTPDFYRFYDPFIGDTPVSNLENILRTTATGESMPKQNGCLPLNSGKHP